MSNKRSSKRKPRIDLNPSSADRWTTCTASPQYIYDNWDKVVEDTATTYNIEGTTAHEVAAALLQDRPIDSENCPSEVTPEMHWHAWNYAEYIESLRHPESKLLVEQKLPLWYMGERNMVVDAAVINPASLHVVDYKYGAGIIVSTERNLQGTIYARGIGGPLQLPDAFPVSIHIYQPRGRAAEDSPFHRWDTTWRGIKELSDPIHHSANEITVGGLFEKNSLRFAPSEKACQWCPAKGFCTAREKAITSSTEGLTNLDAPDLAKPTTLTVENMAAVLRHGDAVIKWVNDVRNYALNWVKAGNKIPGFKLVTSRGGNRKWSNERLAAKLLLKNTILRDEEVWEKSLISPAAVEKLLGKRKMTEDLLNLIGRAPGWPVLAPEDDKRESCISDAAAEFDNLDVY